MKIIAGGSSHCLDVAYRREGLERHAVITVAEEGAGTNGAAGAGFAADGMVGADGRDGGIGGGKFGVFAIGGGGGA